MTRPDSAPTVPTLAGANALSVAPPAALAALPNPALALPNPALGPTACHDLRGAHSGTAHTPHSGKGMDLIRASRGQSAPRGSGNTDRCCVVQRRQCSFSLEPQETGTTEPRVRTQFCQLSEATEYDILLHV